MRLFQSPFTNTTNIEVAVSSTAVTKKLKQKSKLTFLKVQEKSTYLLNSNRA